MRTSRPAGVARAEWSPPPGWAVRAMRDVSVVEARHATTQQTCNVLLDARALPAYPPYTHKTRQTKGENRFLRCASHQTGFELMRRRRTLGVVNHPATTLLQSNGVVNHPNHPATSLKRKRGG